MRLSAVVAVAVVGCGFAKPPRSNTPPQPMGNIATDMPADRTVQSRRLYLDLIAGMRRTGRAHAALAHLDAFEKQYPNSADAAVLRGDCLVDLKDFAGAAVVYRKLLKGREAAAAHAGLGRIEGLGGRWPAASAEFGRAVGMAPTNVDFLNDYGFALLQAGDRTQALFRIRQAAELAPADARVRNNLILALAATGNEPEARQRLAAIPDPDERREIEAAMAAPTPPATP